MPNDKTVIVLGAGFSADSGIMVQNGMLANLKLWASNLGGEILNQWSVFEKFFIDTIGPDLSGYLIEDIFTIFDKCLIDDIGYKGATVVDIQNSRSCLMNVISSCFVEKVNHLMRPGGQKNSYNDLAKEFVAKRDSYKLDDKFSIISLNWDHYFERMIDYVRQSKSAAHPKIQIDYCVYEETMSPATSIPSVNKKAKDLHNFKILKPHGSINWGECPECGRLYITLGNQIRNNYHCMKYCSKLYNRQIALKSTIITPTFLKNIEGTHLDSIWHNASIEISEATNLIFIGYSLRPEDYLFRFILSKSYQKGVKIDIYDFAQKGERRKKKNEIQRKFTAFFQNAIVRGVYVDGWSSNIQKIVAALPA